MVHSCKVNFASVTVFIFLQRLDTLSRANSQETPIRNFLQAYATDLDGNIIWGYDYPDRDANSIIQPLRLLPNGHFAMLISYPSQNVFTPALHSKVNTLREIDLAGNTLRELTLDQLNQRA